MRALIQAFPSAYIDNSAHRNRSKQTGPGTIAMAGMRAFRMA
jgi:hypothetical protein